MPTRSASAAWEGTLKDGKGKLRVGSGLFEHDYDWGSRFAEGDLTNPEELIGAAHAGCFTMQLSLGLSQAGHPPESLNTEARVQLRQEGGKPAISRIDLVTRGRVPGIDEAAFQEAAQDAKDNCIISRALAGVGDMTVDARLET